MTKTFRTRHLLKKMNVMTKDINDDSYSNEIEIGMINEFFS